MKRINYPSPFDLSPEQSAFVGRAIDRGQTFIKRAIAERRIPPTAASLISVREHITLAEITAILGEVAEISLIFPKAEGNATEAFTEAVRRAMDALDEWLSNFEDRNAQLIEDLVDETLNSACRYIQTQLGVLDGDAAGAFFGGEERNVLRRYVVIELRALKAQDKKMGAPIGGLD
ncbi:hypothetical protein [Cupriavidus pampae]|uniref:Uncharacterized protein n=1 Tax=Cupriavidus pampae TaxID=659251 RepID=A0ABN7ZKF7_9BURK|nr:hypothetical protein [Cupriavidus pampae]CAG9185708.1 hypothetical protein LMG32289_06068 [Cupriavidus pampae]